MICVLQNYWDVFPNLRSELFLNGVRSGYFKIKYPSDEITGVVQDIKSLRVSGFCKKQILRLEKKSKQLFAGLTLQHLKVCY